MSELEINFAQLDNYIRISVNDEQSLIAAKQLCESWINSNRQMEKITNIEQLLNILKRRGLYNESEYNILKVLRKIIQDPVFFDMVDHQKLLLSYRQEQPSLQNIYAKNRSLNIEKSVQFEKTQEVPNTKSQTKSPIPMSKRNKIMQIIANGISTSDFSSFARCLRIIDDNEIRDIEIKYRDFRTRTMVVLSIYETRSNSLPKLISALGLIGRLDLQNAIRNI